MNNHFYNKNLKQYARELRTESVSKAEKYIWKVNGGVNNGLVAGSFEKIKI